MSINFLFPTPVSSKKIENFALHKEDLVEWAYKFRETNPGFDSSVFVSSWQSLNKKIFDDYDFSEFIGFISNQLSSSLDSFNLSISEISLNEMWLNFHSKNGYSLRTKNLDSSFTGILWIKVESGNGNLVFENESNHKTIRLYGDKFCQDNNIFERYGFRSEEGMMIIFPSSIPYYFEQNLGDSEIISLGFNLNVQ